MCALSVQNVGLSDKLCMRYFVIFGAFYQHRWIGPAHAIITIALHDRLTIPWAP